MRKLSIPILSTLIAGLVFSPVEITSAAIYDRDTTWWSVEELLEFYPAVEAEKDAECGSNQDCRMEFGFNMIERGKKYSALSNLLESQFWITSINPETETIKVLVFDDDMMLRRMGIEEKLELENLYIGWTEDWLGHGYYHNFDALFDNSMPGVHQLFNSEIEDVASIIPWQENEFPMLDSDISSNTTGVLYFTIYAKYNMFNAQGSTSYANCLNSPDYQAGMECKLYISGDQWASYFPPREPIVIEEMPIVEVVESDNTEPSNPKPDDTESENNELEPTVNQENADPDPVNNEPILEITETGNDDTDNTSNVGTIDNSIKPTLEIYAPETGTVPIEGTNATEFPWWLGAIVALNILTLAWLFLPFGIKTPKNTTKHHCADKTSSNATKNTHFFTKKYQKTLDKIPHLR